MKKFVIIGFPKCGQNSLITFLQKAYNLPIVDENGNPPVTKNEFIWHDDGVKKMLKLAVQGYKCVIIHRNPPDRIWSSYHYFGYATRMSFKEYLKYEGYNKVLGEENPIKQSRYGEWIKKYSHFKPMIFDMDILANDLRIDFPKINKTDNLPPMPENDRKLVLETLI